MAEVEFLEFPKIPRYNRPCVITEKIDGTNACVIVTESETFEGREVYAQSRNRIITPESDNYGFARWVENNKDCLRQLGPGHHYGEWWGNGIQRNYGLSEKRFSLFNTSRWGETRPACCHVVPVLGYCNLDKANEFIELLKKNGSFAAPGFMDPEGIMVYSMAANHYFKITITGDEAGKTWS